MAHVYCGDKVFPSYIDGKLVHDTSARLCGGCAVGGNPDGCGALCDRDPYQDTDDEDDTDD